MDVCTTQRRAQVNGAKTLVLDASLAGPLGLVTEVSLLKVRLGLLNPCKENN
jgi:hypothetical protein